MDVLLEMSPDVLSPIVLNDGGKTLEFKAGGNS